MPTRIPAPNPSVAALLSDLEHPHDAAIHVIRAAILGADPGIGEGIKWNAPSYHLAGAHFATFNLRSRDAVQLILHLGAKPRPDAQVRAALEDAGVPLDWKSPDRAILTVRSTAEAKAVERSLRVVIQEWLRHL